MEVEFASHDLDAKVSKNEVVVTLTNVSTGVTYHWTWPKSKMTAEHIQTAIDKHSKGQVQDMLRHYSQLSKEQMAREICGTLHKLDVAKLSSEDEALAISNLGHMMLLPYIIQTKAWDVLMSNDAVKDHNTIGILVDYDGHGYVIRPCATSHCETYEESLNANVTKSMQLAHSIGWLKKHDGKWTLLNNEGQTIHVGMSKGMPKPGAPGSNVTRKKKRKKRK